MPPNASEVKFNIVYKTLGFKWLIEAFCPASTFVSADRDEARNPQRFIHVTVMGKLNKRHNGMTQTREPPILTLIENRTD